MGGSDDTSFNRASIFSRPPTGVLSRSVTLLRRRRLFCILHYVTSRVTTSVPVNSMWKRATRFTVSRSAARGGVPDSGGSGLKYKVKVLLRSQSKLMPPLLAYSRAAYGDTKWRSMSITDGAAQESKSLELTLICVINQLAASAGLTWVAANASQRGDLKSVCYNNITMTQALQQFIRITVTCLMLTPGPRGGITIILIVLVGRV